MSSQSNVPASATLSTSTEIPPVESSPQIDLNNFAPEDFYVAHEMKLQAQVQETKVKTQYISVFLNDYIHFWFNFIFLFVFCFVFCFFFFLNFLIFSRFEQIPAVATLMIMMTNKKIVAVAVV